MARRQIIASDKSTTLSGGKGEALTKVIYKMIKLRQGNLLRAILLVALGVFLFSAPLYAEPRERRERLESVTSFRSTQIQQSSFADILHQKLQNSDLNTNINPITPDNPGSNSPALVKPSVFQEISQTAKIGQNQQIQKNSRVERSRLGLSEINRNINIDMFYNDL
jgi:hypothetical protein